MRLYIIRHGHKAIANPDFECAYNTPLSDTGKEQAEYLAEFLADEGIDELYSSCALRALQTAEPVDQRLDCDWHVWPVFTESTTTPWKTRFKKDPETAEEQTTWRTGEPIDTPTPEELESWDGNYYLLSSLPDRYPVELSQPFPWPDAWWVPRKGQIATQGHAYAEMGVQGLLARHEDEDDTVAVICHGNTGNMMLNILMDFPRHTSFSHSNTGVTCLTGSDDWTIKYANRTSHLPPDLQI